MTKESKPRIAVVSPFLDKQHGTELCVAEQVERLADEYEFHVYSTRIADMDTRKFTWHRIPDIPGPHLVKYIWFFSANHIWRWLGRVSGRLDVDLTYSPGVNCLDADVIAVHVIFAKFYRSMREGLSFRKNRPRFWLRLLHRRLLYGLFIFLEQQVYAHRDLPLIAVSSKVRDDLGALYGREDNVFDLYNGVDPLKFNSQVRNRSRAEARRTFGYSEGDFIVLLIGNDWNNKGLRCLLEAVWILNQPQVRILVVGTDDPKPYQLLLRQRSPIRVEFFPPRSGPELYYAAADAYVGPSLEDAFGLPPLEAMACGLPVIVSRYAGVSELVKHEENGCILEDPRNANELAALILRLYEDEGFRARLGQNARQTSCAFTWQRNAEHLKGIFQQFLDSKELQSLPAAGET